MTKSDKLFCIVCFQELMRGEEKYPSYLLEKADMLDDIEFAYRALDRSNQHKVLRYYSKHNLTLPETIAKYELEYSFMMVDYLFRT